jgi:glucokinase
MGGRPRPISRHLRKIKSKITRVDYRRRGSSRGGLDGTGSRAASDGDRRADARRPRAPGSVADLAPFLRNFWTERGAPPLIGAAVAAEGKTVAGRLILEAGGVIEEEIVRRALNTARVHLMTAIQAGALGAPRTVPAQHEVLYPGAPDPNGAILATAPEERLSASFALRAPDGSWIAGMSNAQMMSIRSRSVREAAVVQALQAAGLRTVGAVLCRAGLPVVYDCLARLEGTRAAALSADAVIARAADNVPAAQEAVRFFCSCLGAFVGRTSLTLAASGGVYIAGVFMQELAPVFDKRAFAEALESSGPVSGYAVPPVWRAMAPLALLGLSGLFSASDIRVDAHSVLLLDC